MFRSRTPPDATDLITKLLVYNPERRLKPIDALLHGFFDELRDENTRLPNGNALPDLFEFQKEEISTTSPQIMEQLVPEWYIRKKQREKKHGGAGGDLGEE